MYEKVDRELALSGENRMIAAAKAEYGGVYECENGDLVVCSGFPAWFWVFRVQGSEGVLIGSSRVSICGHQVGRNFTIRNGTPTWDKIDSAPTTCYDVSRQLEEGEVAIVIPAPPDYAVAREVRSGFPRDCWVGAMPIKQILGVWREVGSGKA